MITLQRLRDDFERLRRGTSKVPPVQALREICTELLDGVAPERCGALFMRLDRLRRADDMRDLRSALFDLVSREFGETVARERLSTLDAAIASMPRSAFRTPRDAGPTAAG